MNINTIGTVTGRFKGSMPRVEQLEKRSVDLRIMTVTNKAQLMAAISAIDYDDPPTAIINERKDGMRTKYLFRPRLFQHTNGSMVQSTLEGRWEGHLTSIRGNIKKIPDKSFE